MSSLYDACRSGDVDRIAAYLAPDNQGGGDCGESDARQMTMLHHAAYGGHPAIVAMLSARPDCNVDATDALGWTPLHYAASNCHAEVARALLDAGCNTSARDAMHRTPLHVAATSMVSDIDRRIATIKVLLDNGCNPRVKNVAGFTPGASAIAAGLPPEVTALFPEGSGATVP